MVYNFFDKKTSGIYANFMPNQQIANELHKPIIKKILLLKTIFGV